MADTTNIPAQRTTAEFLEEALEALEAVDRERPQLRRGTAAVAASLDPVSRPHSK